jgi:hypothetical protein
MHFLELRDRTRRSRRAHEGIVVHRQRGFDQLDAQLGDPVDPLVVARGGELEAWP